MQFLPFSVCILTGIACVFGATMKPLNKTECIEWHNIYRTKHQAPNVNWSNTVEEHAQAWADYLAKNDLFQHASNTNGEGENLYTSGGDSYYSCRSAIKLFYNEVKYYDYSDAKFSAKTGHFTQVVWIKSTEIGVGKAKTAKGATIVVFRYKPAGNVGGQFAENVKPPIGGDAFVHRASFIYTLAFAIISVFIAQQLF